MILFDHHSFKPMLIDLPLLLPDQDESFHLPQRYTELR